MGESRDCEFADLLADLLAELATGSATVPNGLGCSGT
jgi:hypothetical protein